MASSNIQKGKLDLPKDDGEERVKVEKKRRTPKPTMRLERAPKGGNSFLQMRSSLDNLSDDVNVRALEIEALFEQTKEKDATISKLKKENAKLKQDVAQQAGKVKAFEEWKNLMKSTLDLEASGIK